MGRPGPKLSALTLFSNSHQPRSLLIAVRPVDRAAHFYIISCKLRLVHDPLSRSSVCDSDTDTCERACARHTCDRSNSNLKTNTVVDGPRYHRDRFQVGGRVFDEVKTGRHRRRRGAHAKRTYYIDAQLMQVHPVFV